MIVYNICISLDWNDESVIFMKKKCTTSFYFYLEIVLIKSYFLLVLISWTSINLQFNCILYLLPSLTASSSSLENIILPSGSFSFVGRQLSIFCEGRSDGDLIYGCYWWRRRLIHSCHNCVGQGQWRQFNTESFHGNRIYLFQV